MAPSARVPIWFVFATFGLGHLFGNNVRICQGQIKARIGCFTPCSKGREMCVCVHASVDGHLRTANEPEDWRALVPGRKLEKELVKPIWKWIFFPFLSISAMQGGGGVDLGKEIMGICSPQINRRWERTRKYTYRGRNGLPSRSLCWPHWRHKGMLIWHSNKELQCDIIQYGSH